MSMFLQLRMILILSIIGAPNHSPGRVKSSRKAPNSQLQQRVLTYFNRLATKTDEGQKKALDHPRASIILGTPMILITLLMLYARNERLISALVFGIPFIKK